MWVVYSLPCPMTTRAEGTCIEEASRFAQVIFGLPDSATCTFRFLARRQDGVRKDKGSQWTEEARKELHFPRLGLCDNQSPQVLLPLALTFRVPQPVMSHLEG